MINAVIALGGSLYGDDFRISTMIGLRGAWSASWLIDWGQNFHFVPLQHAIWSVLVSIAPLNHVVGVALMSILLAVALWLMYLCVQELLHSHKRAMLAMAVLGLSPLLTTAQAWLVQATSLFTVYIGGLLATLALIKYWQQPARKWLYLGLVGWLIAALTWESWLVWPPLLGLAALAWQPEGNIFQRIRVAWLGGRRFWWLTIGVLVTYLAIWRAGSFASSTTRASPLAVADAAVNSLFTMVISTYFGGPWRWASADHDYYPAANLQVTAFVLTVIVFTVMLMVAQRLNAQRLWLLLICLVVAPVMSVALPLYARFNDFGSGLGQYPRYFAPVLPFIALGLVMLAASLWQGRSAPLRRPVAIGLVATLVVSLLVTNTGFVRQWWQNPAGDWVSQARLGLTAHDPGNGIFDSEVPPSVLNRIFTPYNSAQAILLPVTEQATFGKANSSVMFDGTGGLVPAAFRPINEVHNPSCEAAEEAHPRSWVFGNRNIHEANMTLRLTGIAGPEGAELKLDNFDGTRTVGSYLSNLLLSPGPFSVYVLTPPNSFDGVTVTTLAGQVCVTSLVVGAVEAAG